MTRLFAIAATALLMGGAAPALAQESSASDTSETTEAQAPMVTEMRLGNPEAEVTVIEYASFTCPHCKNFHAGPFKELKENYMDTGKINFIYREVYFDRYGLWAGMVARCGGPTRYFGLANLIYENQSEWTKGEPAEIAANLRKLGKTAGLGDEQLDACLSDGDKAQAMVEVFETTSKADDITSTPSFVIDGEKYSNMNYEDFSAILDEKLGETEAE